MCSSNIRGRQYESARQGYAYKGFCMLMLSEIAKILNGHMLGEDVLVQSVGTDSRNIVKNQLFVGIKGEHFDGNTFALEAIQQGAAAVLVSDHKTQAIPAVVVVDARLALGQLAKHWRQQFILPLVAITGSNGKTTVKEMVASILAVPYKSILATQGNLNNDIGMPLTLLKIRAEHAVAVIEMGMNHQGEIRYLTNIAQPTVAVVNNAGTAHIGELGSREAIARAKGEIYEGLATNGIAIINADDDFADYWKTLNKNKRVITFGLDKPADVSATYEIEGNLTQINLKTAGGDISFKLSVLGVHNIRNALAASAVAAALGVTNIDIAKGLAVFGAVKGRLNWLVGANGAVVIDDTYNANPDSMKAAIDVLANQKMTLQTSVIFVMGDMAELGVNAPQMHADIGMYAKQKGILHLLTLGELSAKAAHAFDGNAQHFTTVEALVASLNPLMNSNSIVLVKGSRFMQMERVVNLLIGKSNVLEEA
jgi:UDP-N-acetylmuramoyl-tripeptide--D-alanyl-D-alanine ligase